jgi:hypothetical protein
MNAPILTSARVLYANIQIVLCKRRLDEKVSRALWEINEWGRCCQEMSDEDLENDDEEKARCC